MDEEKKTVYTLILGACMIISLILIARMMLYHPVPIHTPPGTQSQQQPLEIKQLPAPEQKPAITLTEKDIEGMIENQLPDNFPLSDIKVKIKEDSIDAIGGLKKENLLQYLKANGYELTAPLQAALMLVPDEFSLSCRFQVGTDHETGLLLFTPEKVSAGSVEIPSAVLIPSVFASINQAVNDALCNSDIYFTQIILKEGAVELMP